MTQEIINYAVKIVLLIIVALLTRYVVPFIKSKINTEKFSLIVSWVAEFVNAAEMIFKEPKSGEEKYKAVAVWLTDKANNIGVTLTQQDVQHLIESAVKEMNNYK